MMKSAALLGLALSLCTASVLAKPPQKQPAPPPPAQAQPQQKSFSFSFGSGKGRLGTSVVSLTEELRLHFGAPADAGILVSKVEPGSPAQKAGIKVGDVITKVDGDVVTDSSDVSSALADKKSGDAASVVVVRNKRALTLSAKLDSDDDESFDFEINLDGTNQILKGSTGKAWQWNFTWPPSPNGKQQPTPQQKRFQDRLKKLEKKYKSGKPTTT
jgi:membrane-associated protease RseP (regulator of RpoE activity)